MNLSFNTPNIKYVLCFGSHHHGEDDCGWGSFDDPEQHKAGKLGQSEQMDLPQRNMT